ncbi:hypothetical protein GJAV_G00259850 [Gymnothorax javanicus]|nr:hypothetical protein GJAV_G00259850 [Gymnothorax javanicus]
MMREVGEDGKTVDFNELNIHGHKIRDLRYVDDTILLSCGTGGLSLLVESVVSGDGDGTEEIRRRLAMATNKLSELKLLWKVICEIRAVSSGFQSCRPPPFRCTRHHFTCQILSDDHQPQSLTMHDTNIIFFLFSIFAPVTLGNQDDCVYKPAGGDTTIQLGHPNVKIDDLRWSKDEIPIFKRRKGKISLGKEADVTLDGSLLLKHLNASHSGIYEGQVYDKDGKSYKSPRQRICVKERVAKPTVFVDCEKRTLTCQLEPDSKPGFSWMQNGKILSRETSNTIKIIPEQKKPSKYSCTVKNEVSKETSKEIDISCKGVSSGTSAWSFWDFDSLPTILILAGGGTLLLILVVVIVGCICRKRRHDRKLQRDEEELRLANLMHSQQPHPPAHHTHQAPPTKTHAGQCGYPQHEEQPPALPKPRTQNRPRPSHPTCPATGQEHAPPRPKPRRGPRTPRS